MSIKNGDTVVVHYTGTLEDGTEFDSSRDNEPLEVTLGKGMLIEGFEKALLGHKAGDIIKVRIKPEDAYGEPEEELIITVPVSELPEELEVEPGMELSFDTDEGPIDLTVIAIEDGEVILDANHPLAGETLNFEIEVLKVN